MLFSHYNYIKQRYPDSALLFTNTDSLMYQFQTNNVYEDFYVDKHLFNFSGYKKESPFYNDENNKVIGKMKDELNGKIIKEMSVWRQKCIHWKHWLALSSTHWKHWVWVWQLSFATNWPFGPKKRQKKIFLNLFQYYLTFNILRLTLTFKYTFTLTTMTNAFTVDQKSMWSNWTRHLRCLRLRNCCSNPCVVHDKTITARLFYIM